MLAGQFASLTVELEDLTRRLRGSFPLLLCDSLPTSRYLAAAGDAQHQRAAAVPRRQP